MQRYLQTYFNNYTEAAPLAVFRVFFGIMMFTSIIRFWSYGWIEKLYLEPDFHFSFYGFSWVHPFGQWTYLLFIVCAISSVMITLGWKYRIAMITFFLSFTYIEFMDKTTYLNHYYFISILSFLLIFLPAAHYFSLDVLSKKYFKKRPKSSTGVVGLVPQWNIDSIKLLLGIVYIYAGLAKLNSDWLFKAMPLKIWLPSKYNIPLIGDLLKEEWVHYAFSWMGAGYDLLIPFLLLWKPTRTVAFLMVVIFHVLTRILFPIGMFPYIMIISALIFFDASFHNRILNAVAKVVKYPKTFLQGTVVWKPISVSRYKISILIVAMFFCIQLLMPWRYLLYPGELFWTEEGYRFSWRVMLMEKAGYANFKIVEQETGSRFYVDNDDFLTVFQQKQMATQADLIVEYAHYLGDHFASQGHENIEIYVESYASLNGRPSQPYIDPDVDLMKLKNGLHHKTYILPMHE